MASFKARSRTTHGTIGRRAVLLSTVAVGALFVAAHPVAADPDACAIAANVATCSGNQSGGIDAGDDFNAPPVNTLVINNLTQDIGSNDSGGDGIRWAFGVGGHGPINIISDTGGFAIRTTADGMNLFDPGGDPITVNHRGNIFAGSIGIRAGTVGFDGGPTVAGTVSVTMIGNIVSGSSGILANSTMQSGNGDTSDVTVSFTGNITSNLSSISASSNVEEGNGNSGNVTVESNGNFNGRISGLSNVFGNGNSGIVDVKHQGQGRGISAESLVGGNGNSGAVIVSNTGNMSGRINARTIVGGIGDVATISVTNVGNISDPGQLVPTINASAFAQTNGNAGAVSVTSTGNLTGGGIFAESKASGAGNASSTSVTSSGNIVAGISGIFAQSLAAAGTAGAVTVTSTGNITAGNVGIIAQSKGDAGQGNILVTINNGTVRGGSVAGVLIIDGAANALTIGSNAALLSLTGSAIVGGVGDETISNSGIVTGNVSLGAGVNTFNNLAGAMVNSGSIVDLGALGVLDNAGTFAPGGIGAAPITTTLTGKFDQGADGVFAVDVANGTADRVNVSDTAALAGKVKAMVSSLTSLTQQFTILSAAGGTTNNGITVQDTAVFDYELLFPNANDIVLAVTANFTPNGVALTPNQRVTAAHLQSGLLAGGGNLGGLINYLGGFANGASYAAALDRLHPEPYLAPVQSALLANLGFTDGLMSCPTLANTDANAFIAEGQCAWARMGARQLDVDRTAENTGYRDKAWGGSAGVQFALAPDWFGSIALGYDRSDIKVDDRASASGDLLHMGAGAKYIHGNWQISAALAGGHATYDVTRSAVMPGVNTKGDLSLNFLSGRLRTAYVFGSDNAYVKPMVDVDFVGMWRGGLQESGAGPAGLNVQAQTDVLFSVAPSVELGGRFAYANNSVLQPFLRAGVRLFSEDDLKATASFIGSPADVPAFTVTTPLDQWMAEMSAGLEMLSTDRFDARLSYEGRFGENVTQHGGSVKLRAKL